MNLFTAHCKLAIKTRNYLSLGWQAFFCCGSPFIRLSSWPGTRKAAFSRQRKPIMRSIGLECSLLPASSVARTRAALRCPPSACRASSFQRNAGEAAGPADCGGAEGGGRPSTQEGGSVRVCGGRRESFEVRERSEKSSRSPRLVKQIKLRFLKEIVHALWHRGPSCPCRLSAWHREPLAASRSRPARRDARKKAACGLDHAEDAPPDAPPLGAFTWVLAGLPATRGTPSGLSPRAPLLSDSVPCLCPSTVWSSL